MGGFAVKEAEDFKGSRVLFLCNKLTISHNTHLLSTISGASRAEACPVGVAASPV